MTTEYFIDEENEDYVIYRVDGVDIVEEDIIKRENVLDIIQKCGKDKHELHKRIFRRWKLDKIYQKNKEKRGITI